MSAWLAKAQRAAVQVAEELGEDSGAVLNRQKKAAEASGSTEPLPAELPASTLEEVFAGAQLWVETLRSAISEEEAKHKERQAAVETDRQRGLDEVAAQRKLLEAERAALDAEKERVTLQVAEAATIVKLNIGGTKFEASRKNFTGQPGSLLDSVFSGRHAVDTDEEGYVFIDRDADTFKLLLAYLRSPALFSLDGLTAREVVMLRSEFAHFEQPWPFAAPQEVTDIV